MKMKCDRLKQTFCEQMDYLKDDKAFPINLAKADNLMDPGAGPRLWISVDPMSYMFLNFCPLCGGDWSFKEGFRKSHVVDFKGMDLDNLKVTINKVDE